jgi:predicted nucleic acid-binding protein
VNSDRCDASADTSFVLNLLATTRAERILDGASLRLVVPPRVRAELTRETRALEALAVAGRARFLELPRSASALYVEAAMRVEDDEAQAIALGIALGIALVTDDGRTADAWQELARSRSAAPLSAQGICDVLRTAQPGLGPADLRDSVERLGRDASFGPPSGHASWWSAVLSMPTATGAR